MDPIRVLVVDDHPLVRHGVAALIAEEEDIIVAGEAPNGREAFELVRESRPDVVLMDLVMPEMDGIAATRAIRARYPEVKVLVLTSVMNDEQILPALHAGASGYLLKDIPSHKLMEAIRQAQHGETPLSPGAAERLVAGIREPRNKEEVRLASLTERERQVLAHIGQGRNNKEIAARLAISEKTVKFHVSGILNKLCLGDRTQAALLAVRKGLVTPDVMK